jgi:hypothetical protein
MSPSAGDRMTNVVVALITFVESLAGMPLGTLVVWVFCGVHLITSRRD